MNVACIEQSSSGLPVWFSGRRRTCERQCGGHLTFIFGTESRIWGQAIRTLLICSAAQSVDLRLAFSLCSVQTEGVVSHIFLKHYTRKGQRDLQTDVSLLINSWPFWGSAFHVTINEPPCSTCSSLLPHLLLLCYFPEPRNMVLPFGPNPGSLDTVEAHGTAIPLLRNSGA